MTKRHRDFTTAIVALAWLAFLVVVVPLVLSLADGPVRP
jgi:hypothetical protein